jgi:hypothetical protein
MNKQARQSLWFFCIALLLNEIYLTTKFLATLVVLELFPDESSKCKKQRTITQN